MPYIKGERRKPLDYWLDPLIEALRKATEMGEKNTGDSVYVVYKILKYVYGDGNFEVKSNAEKVVNSAIREYYRKIMAPYEDKKSEENGDI